MWMSCYEIDIKIRITSMPVRKVLKKKMNKSGKYSTVGRYEYRAKKGQTRDRCMYICYIVVSVMMSVSWCSWSLAFSMFGDGTHTVVLSQLSCAQ